MAKTAGTDAIVVRTCRPLLNVSDIEASLRFWQDTLGFEIAQRFEQAGRLVFVSLRSGDVEVMLNAHGGDPAARRARPHYTEAVLYFGVDSVHELARELRARGLNAPEPETQPYGLDEFVLRDPDGYEIAFTSPTDSAWKKHLDEELDEALEESFPASDPPAVGQPQSAIESVPRESARSLSPQRYAQSGMSRRHPQNCHIADFARPSVPGTSMVLI
jgi:uncharacterized glyoxalase superfamily protein PhnB